jgi:PEP-CTERM motif
MFGASTGNQLTFSFSAPQEDLQMLVSYLDGNWEIDVPYTISTDFNTLAINGDGDLYSTIFDGSIPSFNQGRGVILFSSPVSSFTMTKINGSTDDFYIGMATPVPEPSSALFIISAGLVSLFRRRR